MEVASILKTDEARQIIGEVVREQIKETYIDMEDIRRSPAGAVIRIEEEIKSIKQNMTTKADLNELKGDIKGLSSKVNLITSLTFIMLTLYGALIVKLIFFP